MRLLTTNDQTHNIKDWESPNWVNDSYGSSCNHYMAEQNKKKHMQLVTLYILVLSRMI